MQNIRLALKALTASDYTAATVIGPLIKQADKWNTMPKGWTNESRKRFWESLTGDSKHKVTKCIAEMSGKDIDDPGAFCAALADRVLGPSWRKKKKARMDKWILLEGSALAKAMRLFKPDSDANNWYVWHQKIRGKTVFMREHGSSTLYVVGVDGHAYSVKGFTGAFSVRDLSNLVDSAMTGEIDPKSGVYRNFKVADTKRTSQPVPVDRSCFIRLANEDGVTHRYAFNKYNAPEVMGQLIGLLREFNLEEPLELLIKHRIPQAVDRAWQNRNQTSNQTPEQIFDGLVASPDVQKLVQSVQKIAKDNMLMLCYQLAEAVNWHAINRANVFGYGLNTAVDHTIISKLARKLDYSVSRVAVFCMALLNTWGYKGVAARLKQFALRELDWGE